MVRYISWANDLIHDFSLGSGDIPRSGEIVERGAAGPIPLHSGNTIGKKAMNLKSLLVTLSGGVDMLTTPSRPSNLAPPSRPSG